MTPLRLTSCGSKRRSWTSKARLLKRKKASRTGRADQAICHGHAPFRFWTEGIEAIIEFWRTRPKKPEETPYAFTLCKHTIRLFKHFLRWLHKEKSFPWKKPVDLDIDRIKIVPDAEIKYKVETYSKEELAILWQHATFFERQLLLLALNCGFSISEIGSLDWKEVEGEIRQRAEAEDEGLWGIPTLGDDPEGARRSKKDRAGFRHQGGFEPHRSDERQQQECPDSCRMVSVA